MTSHKQWYWWVCHYCISNQGCNRHILLRGRSYFSSFFARRKMFFPSKNSHFGRPKTNFHHFQKWKAKKKKKSSPLFITFPTSISNFPPSLLQFSFFSSQFSPLFLFLSIFTPFPLPLFFWYVSKNFLVRSLWGALCPPVLPPVTQLSAIRCETTPSAHLTLAQG